MRSCYLPRAARHAAVSALALLAAASPSRVDAQNGALSATGLPSDSAHTVTVTGIVYDSLGAHPLPSADIQLVDTVGKVRAYNARSDSAGRFTIPNVRPGVYFAGFFHPLTDALGVTLPVTTVTVPPTGAPLVTLAVPGGARILPVVCGPRAPRDSSGAMAGTVRDANTGAPVANANVVATWTEIVLDSRGIHTARRRVPVATREDGTYLACNLPGDDDVLVTADARGLSTGLVETHIPTIGVAWRDLTVGDSTSVTTTLADSSNASSERLSRGSAQLTGVVRMPDGKPISSARILVWGTGLTTDTHDGGRFMLNGLPAGTFSVEARAIGYEPARVAVNLTNQAPNAVTLTLARHIQGLKAVTIYGKAPPRSNVDDFLARREHGLGHYITAQDIEQHPVFAISDALRMTPGLRIVPSGWGNRIVGRGGCTPSVFLNGVRLYEGDTDIDNIVNPVSVAGIEVYDETTTPPQYRVDACGAVLIWTK